MKQYTISTESYVGIQAMETMRTMFEETRKALGGSRIPSCGKAVAEYESWGRNIPYEGFCNNIPERMRKECRLRRSGEIVWSSAHVMTMSAAALAVSAVLF